MIGKIGIRNMKQTRFNDKDHNPKGVHSPVNEGSETFEIPFKRPLQLWKIAVPIIIVMVILVVLGTIPRLKKDKVLSSEANAAVNTIVAVNVILPVKPVGGTELVLPCNIQGIEETTIFARTAGYVQRRYVDIGSRVTSGDILAVIKSPELDQQVFQARADSAKAVAGAGQATADIAKLQANVAQAQSEHSRSISNVEQSKSDLEHFNAKLEQSKSAVNVAKARMNQAQQNLSVKRADLLHASAQLDLASKTLKRWKELEKAEAVSGQEVDEKQANYDVCLANESAAKSGVNSATADVEAFQATYSSALIEVKAAQADVKSGHQRIISLQEAIKSCLSQVEAAKASVVASRSNLDAAKSNIKSTIAAANRYDVLRTYEKVIAPFSGVITARNIDTGSLINAGSTSVETDPSRTVPRGGMFGIARTDILRVQVNVPQSYVGSINIGQAAMLRIPEYPKRVFKGVVTRTSGALDASSRTLLMEVHIPNTDNFLMPGMFGQVIIPTELKGRLVHVPANCLIVDASGTRVASVNARSKIHFVSVQTGRDLGKELEIKAGLVGDEKLVVNPSDDLIEGLDVRVVETLKR